VEALEREESGVSVLYRLLLTPLSPFEYMARIVRNPSPMAPLFSAFLLISVQLVQAGTILGKTRLKLGEGTWLRNVTVSVGDHSVTIILANLSKTYPLRPPLETASTAALIHSAAITLILWLSITAGLYISMKLLGQGVGPPSSITAGYVMMTSVYSELVRYALLYSSLSGVSRVEIVAVRGADYTVLLNAIRLVLSRLEPWSTANLFVTAFFSVWGFVVVLAALTSAYNLEWKRAFMGAFITAILQGMLIQLITLLLTITVRLPV